MFRLGALGSDTNDAPRIQMLRHFKVYFAINWAHMVDGGSGLVLPMVTARTVTKGAAAGGMAATSM